MTLYKCRQCVTHTFGVPAGNKTQGSTMATTTMSIIILNAVAMTVTMSVAMLVAILVATATVIAMSN